MKLNRYWIITVMLTMLTSSLALADATFTYQGELAEAGEPANGLYDMNFALWNMLDGGLQQGTDVVLPDVSVVAGVFTVELDFGVPALGPATGTRWLEITVQGVPLVPRQPITSAPFAIQTRGIYVDENENVGIGTTTPLADLYIDGTGSTDAALILHEPGASTGELIFGAPAGLPGIIAVANNGNRRDIRFSDGGIEFLTSSTVGSPDAGHGLVINEDGNVGIGTSTPSYPLHVESDGFRAISGRTTASIGANTGVYGESASTTGRGVQGIATANSGTNYGVYGMSDSTSGTGVFGWAFASSGTNYGVVGHSDSSKNGFDFFASGAGEDYGSSSSRRWKHNVEPISDPLRKLAQLRGVFFDWDTEHGGHHDVGMIAEEVGKVLPEIVNYEENGVDAIGMDYSKMTPLLVEAVNALRSESNRRFAEKDDEISELRQQLSDLQQIVERLASNQEKENAQSTAL